MSLLQFEYSTQTVRVFYATGDMKMKLNTSSEFQNSGGKKKSHNDNTAITNASSDLQMKI